jgi:1,4-dihydroxy-2-naphthoate octaprenyltransferase
VTQSGLLKETQVWGMALIFVAFALFFGYFLVVQGGWPIVVLGLLSLFLAYGYTGGPYPLAYLGLGDLFVILFFGLFAVVGTFYLHTLEVNGAALVAGIQMGFLSTTLIAINNLRDSEGDSIVGKKTLAVRFGDLFVKWEVLLLVALSYLLNLYFLVAYNKLYVLLTFALLPLAGFLVGFVFSVKKKMHLNKALGLAALHQVLFALVFTLGVIL